MMWHPIETAPIGIPVLVYGPALEDFEEITVAYGDDGQWFPVSQGECYPMYPDPTHWMPLPDPPET